MQMPASVRCAFGAVLKLDMLVTTSHNTTASPLQTVPLPALLHASATVQRLRA